MQRCTMSVFSVALISMKVSYMNIAEYKNVSEESLVSGPRYSGGVPRPFVARDVHKNGPKKIPRAQIF